MSKSIFLQFDTYSSTSSYTNDPISCSFQLPHTVHGIKTVSLKSIELPYCFYNIRSDNGTNQFTLTIGSQTNTCSLTSASYSSATTLCSDLTTAMASLFTSNSPTFSVSSSQIKISVTTSAVITVTQTNLSQILGFTSGQTTTGTSLTGTGFYNLSYDTYIGMKISNIPNFTNSSYAFKIINPNVSNTIIYDADNQTFHQSIYVYDENINLSYINVSFVDRFNCQITNNNGVGYSFTLLFELF